ncbi:phosphotransferase family protein [Plantactinospora sonchi]|uniref:Phosphotransferase n=1 Tax=Plantactinospora sonchi TaxID=1544735 RepID=A0ABU7RXV1_9ACTN
MTSAVGVRIGWADLPASVRAAVEEILGDRVVAAVSQAGGFSPGTADRVRTAGGRRAFVKAAGAALNPVTPELHRREARNTAALPADAPAPRLIGWHDDGDWVALVLTDVEGRHPTTPWREDELATVLGTLGRMADLLTPAPVPDAPSAADLLGDDFSGWRRIAADPPADLDPWATGRLDGLVTLAERGLAALAGDTLAHVDIRADNLLLDADGRVTVVDWPHACRGPAWLDTLCLLANVRLHNGRYPLLDRYALDTGAEPAQLTAVLAGITGFFVDAARLPAPPGLPTVRAFQRAHADALLPWLRERLDG